MPNTQTVPSPFRAPSMALLFAEPFRAMLDALGSHVTPHPKSVGDGHPVIVYPGLGAGSRNTSQLRTFLKHAGFASNDWGGGVNIGHEGEFDAWLDGLADNMREVQDRHDGRKVSLIGWSLGGVYARELAKELPHMVRGVITLGSPFAGSHKATNAWRIYELTSGRSVERESDNYDLPVAPPVPTISIYSRTDGVVAWQASIQTPSAVNPQTENIEVLASHIGLGVNPSAWWAVADRLAQAEGRWKPFPREDKGRLHGLVYPDPARA